MVYEHIDTIDSLMARYVAGSLPAPARVLVESHLEIKDDYRGYVRDLEALAGQALEAMPTAETPQAGREAMLEAIFSSKAPPLPVGPKRSAASSIMPAVLRDFVGYDVENIPWRTRMPGFKEFDLGEIDGCHTSMFWIKPGRRIPAHTHQGCELSLVLDGAFRDGVGRYGRGDISVADDSVDHRPVAEAERACIGFAVVDAPLRLTGSFRQLIGDLIG